MRIESKEFADCIRAVMTHPEQYESLVNTRLTMCVFDMGFKVLTILRDESKTGSQIVFYVPVELINYEVTLHGTFE